MSDLENNRQIPPQTAIICSFYPGGRIFVCVPCLILLLLISVWLIWPGWVLAVPAITDTNSSLSLTTPEKQWLSRHLDEVSLWYDEGFSPFEFSDENDQFVGMGADIVAMVEKKLGMRIRNKIPGDWNTSLTGLESGECAVVPTIVNTPERAEYAFFTRPYARVPIVIITRQNTGYGRSLEDLSRHKVAVVSGYATEGYLRSHKGGHFEILPVENVAEGLRSVAFGVAEAYVGDLATASYHIDSLGITSLQVAGETDYYFDLCIGVSKQFPLLFSSIRKAMDGISRDDLLSLQNKWITLKTRRGIPPETLRFLKVSALFTGLLILGLACITIVLKRRLNRKIGHLKKAQEQIVQNMERFQAGEEKMRVTLNSIGDGVITTNIAGNVTQMNPVAQSFTGWSESEAMGRNLSEVFQIVDDRGNSVENPVLRVISSGKIVGLANHTSLICRDGTRYDIADSGAPIRDKTGEIIGVVLVFRDVTREYALEKQLRQSQKMEAIGTLAGGIAHDFNNILSAQMGFTDLARMSANGNEKLLRYLDNVTSASLRARDLVRQILTFSRKDDVKKELINIRPLILETIEFMRASLPGNIDVHHSLPQEKSLVFGDSTQLHQIFMNLFTNAAHAMGGKGGTIEVSMAEIVKHEDEMIQKVLPGNYLEIIVSDTGVGIPGAIMDRIFEPFFTTKVRGKGTGMGLSTVYGILKDMGGTIEVSSQEDVGTTFTMLIPEQKRPHLRAPLAGVLRRPDPVTPENRPNKKT